MVCYIIEYPRMAMMSSGMFQGELEDATFRVERSFRQFLSYKGTPQNEALARLVSQYSVTIPSSTEQAVMCQLSNLADINCLKVDLLHCGGWENILNATLFHCRGDYFRGVEIIRQKYSSKIN